jgi:hypothetical protein
MKKVSTMEWNYEYDVMQQFNKTNYHPKYIEECFKFSKWYPGMTKLIQGLNLLGQEIHLVLMN